MTTKTKEEYELWKAHNLSDTQSILLHDLCERAFEEGRKASEAENQNLKRENGILRMSLNKLHSDVSMGEHLDSEWIKNTIEQEVFHPVIDASLKMLKVREQTIQQQKELIEEFVQISEHAIDLGYLGEGSTKGEFQKIIEKAKELLK